jgi:hypothetical protein
LRHSLFGRFVERYIHYEVQFRKENVIVDLTHLDPGHWQALPEAVEKARLTAHVR